MEGLTVGRIVHYVLTDDDVKVINGSRITGVPHPELLQGVELCIGNGVRAEEHYPAIVVRVIPNEFGEGDPGVNLQVFLDGNDSQWVVSRRYSEEKEPGTWHWIEKA